MQSRLLLQFARKAILVMSVYLAVMVLTLNVELYSSSKQTRLGNLGKLMSLFYRPRVPLSVRERGNPGKAQYRSPRETFQTGRGGGNGSNDAPDEKKMQAIVIVAGFRTGSSFIGQLFNQHPNAFYFFEPLFYKIWDRSKREPDGEVIKDLLLCNVTSMRNEVIKTWKEMKGYYEKCPTANLRVKLREIEKCISNGICFRHKSRKLCVPSMCRDNVTIGVDCNVHCQQVTAQMVEQECSRAAVRVIKVIRINDIFELRRAWAHPKIDLKIIHLIRDPRSSWLSRATVLTKTYASNVIRRECEKDLQIHSGIKANVAKLQRAKDIYSLLRYEDVIQSPRQKTSSMYDSLHLKEFQIQENVLDWIQKNTKNTDRHAFGTSRNSAAQMYEWRKHIAMDDVAHIQILCRKMMLHFGYKIIQNGAQLLDFKETFT